MELLRRYLEEVKREDFLRDLTHFKFELRREISYIFTLPDQDFIKEERFYQTLMGVEETLSQIKLELYRREHLENLLLLLNSLEEVLQTYLDGDEIRDKSKLSNLLHRIGTLKEALKKEIKGKGLIERLRDKIFRRI